MSQPIGKILVVEDERELRFILTAHLRAAGYDVLEAGTGDEAVEIATGSRPDVIIMDVGLPGMDGIEATRRITTNPGTSDVSVIILTARTGRDHVVRGLDAGAQEYLQKPFDVAELLARVRNVHRLASARRDLDRLNTQLEAEVDQKTSRLETLYHYMRDLNEAVTRDEILDRLIDCVGKVTSARRISLFIRTVNRKRLVCERAIGFDPETAASIAVDEDASITAKVFRTAKTIVATATSSDMTPAGAADPYLQDAFISTPLVGGSAADGARPIGVLNLTNRPGDEPFAREEIEAVRSVADAATIALNNFSQRERLQRSVRVLLRTVGVLAEYRDDETSRHLERVTRFARVLAEQLSKTGPYRDRVTPEFVESIVQAAPMHDIGKVGVPDHILTKRGSLTDAEFEVMKTHTEIGRRVLSLAQDKVNPIPLLSMCIDIAHCHHERWDGRGYPRGLQGEEIPLAARVITLVDAYDAMTSRRRYKEAISHADALAEVRAQTGKHFDPGVVEAFLQCEGRFDAIRARHEDSIESTRETLSI